MPRLCYWEEGTNSILRLGYLIYTISMLMEIVSLYSFTHSSFAPYLHMVPEVSTTCSYQTQHFFPYIVVIGLVGNVADMSPTCHKTSVLLVNLESTCLCRITDTFLIESRVENELTG